MKQIISKIILTAIFAIFLLPSFGQTLLMGSGTLSFNQLVTSTQTAWLINLNETKHVRLTYATSFSLTGDDLHFMDVDADGSYHAPSLFLRGFMSGTYITSNTSGKVLVVLNTPSFGYEIFTLEYTADNSISTTNDLNVGGNTILTGNVGIGTTNPPITKLDVLKTTNTNTNDLIANFQRASGPYTGGSAIIRLGFGATADLEMNTGMNGAQGAGIRYGTYSDFNLVNNSTGLFSGGINFITNGARRMFVNSAGKVGIGTTTPNATLDVFGKQIVGSGSQDCIWKNSTLQITQNPNIETSLNLWQNEFSSAIIGSKPSDTNLYITNDSNDGGLGEANHSIALTIDGEVGIGTISPNATLDVFGKQIVGSGSQGMIWKNSTLQITQNPNIETSLNIWQYGVATAILGSKPNDTNFYITNDYHDGGLGAVNHSIALTIDGKVGIGTTDPASKLDVNGEISMPFDSRIGSILSTDVFSSVYTNNRTMGNYSLGWFSDPWKPDGGTLWVSGWGGMKFFTGGNLSLAIDNSGKVGIGTTKPDALLTVNGTIHAKEVNVTVDIPADYVFNQSYKLMPLNQVEQYVKTNYHLPEIPSASEVSKNGMNMGEMQNKLLQKIEELTLYVIEQQKRIEQLEKNQK